MATVCRIFKIFGTPFLFFAWIAAACPDGSDDMCLRVKAVGVCVDIWTNRRLSGYDPDGSLCPTAVIVF